MCESRIQWAPEPPCRALTFTVEVCHHQFSSVSQSCLTLCDPMDCSMSGFPVHHQLLELIQTVSENCSYILKLSMCLPYNPRITFLSVCYCCVVQLLSHVQLFATPWTAARQASLSFTISLSLLKFTSIELVMPSSHHDETMKHLNTNLNKN